MEKFEYKVISTRWSGDDHKSIKEFENTLNEEGKKGWELVNSNRDSYPADPGNGEEIFLIFKKPVKRK